MSNGHENRAERLAAALRANLRLRKAQTRAIPAPDLNGMTPLGDRKQDPTPTPPSTSGSGAIRPAPDAP